MHLFEGENQNTVQGLEQSDDSPEQANDSNKPLLDQLTDNGLVIALPSSAVSPSALADLAVCARDTPHQEYVWDMRRRTDHGFDGCGIVKSA